jgi:hypothetical protein
MAISSLILIISLLAVATVFLSGTGLEMLSILRLLPRDICRMSFMNMKKN